MAKRYRCVKTFDHVSCDLLLLNYRPLHKWRRSRFLYQSNIISKRRKFAKYSSFNVSKLIKNHDKYISENKNKFRPICKNLDDEHFFLSKKREGIFLLLDIRISYRWTWFNSFLPTIVLKKFTSICIIKFSRSAFTFTSFVPGLGKELIDKLGTL